MLNFATSLVQGVLDLGPTEANCHLEIGRMSFQTVGSSCATLQDGVQYLEVHVDEQTLLQQLQDPCGCPYVSRSVGLEITDYYILLDPLDRFDDVREPNLQCYCFQISSNGPPGRRYGTGTSPVS